MKKKVLFLIGTLQSGGVSKSIISLLNVWDCDTYDTYLLLASKQGDVFSPFLNPKVKVLYSPVIEHVMGGFQSAFWLLRHGHVILFFGVILRLVLSRISRAKAGLLISKMMPVLSTEEYDLIVDYGGQQFLYYMVDKLSGKKKVSFFHSDYSKWAYYYRVDRLYYPRVDRIYTISPTCVDVLRKYFPSCSAKIFEMQNILSSQTILQLSKQQIDLQPAKLQLMTLGHFTEMKGSDLIIETCLRLQENGYDFKWYIVGKIVDTKRNKQVEKLGLDKILIFCGIQPNPYPYLAAADIYVHPSRFEGKSIALDEAKILCKPIVVTNFSTVNDQFENGVNASICEMNANDLTNKIIELAQNTELRTKYIDNLASHVQDNTGEVNKLYSFLN